jgi:serine/threonine-protein kinase
MDPQPADMMIGQTIGNYLVTQKVGEGGMGSVYLAEHPHIGKKVALKVLHQEFSANQEVVTRFFNEAKAVNDIQHPNIVDIVDYGMIQAGGGREALVYFIMEYLAGNGLSNTIRAEGAMPPERALSIGLQVADALSASHKCGIVHRDLKPDNIILVTRGRERDFVKLLDFGIAKLTGDQAGTSRTRTGIVMGTPAYMSPEQCEGRGNVDHRTDIYALGIVLYEMLTGRVPFIGEGYGEILVQHLTQTPIAPSRYHMMPAHVEAVVMKALEKRPELRYPTMDEMIRAMADPVGYVEAHGGVVGFPQRVLTPSMAPLPNTMMRLTPAPASLTPVPGTVTNSGLAQAQVPTTLGASAGQVQGGGSARKVGFVIAGLAIVAAAAVAVVMVMNNKSAPSTTTTVDNGSSSVGSAATGSATATQPAAGSSTTAAAGSATMPATGSATTPAAGSATVATGSAATPATGSGSAVVAAAGSAATPAAGSATGSAATPATGSGGGTTTTAVANTGSAATPPPLPTTVKIKIESSMKGVEIFVNGVDQNVQTDGTVEVPRGDKVHITLKRSGYIDSERDVPSSQDTSIDVPALAVFHRSGGTTPTGTKPTGTKPTGTKPTGTKPTGTKPTGTKPNGQNGGGDNLIRPEDM